MGSVSKVLTSHAGEPQFDLQNPWLIQKFGKCRQENSEFKDNLSNSERAWL